MTPGSSHRRRSTPASGRQLPPVAAEVPRLSLPSRPVTAAFSLRLPQLTFLLSAFLLSAIFAHSQPTSLDLQLAREPATVTTSAKRDFSGLLDGFRDGRLFLRVATGGGEVGYSFDPREIDKLGMPGADLEAQAVEFWERGATADALPLLEALGRQRLRYLPVLNDTQRAPLWLLVQASARAGNPLTTIGYVNRLRSEASSPGQRAVLRDAELGAHLALGNSDETRELAAAWCAEADPAGDSALGWKILAGIAHEAGDFEQARWIALQPVVSASYLPMEFLDTCYVLAISAAHRLKDQDHAAILYRELLARGFEWPADPEFVALGRICAQLASETLSAAPVLDADPGSRADAAPAPDLNQTLEPVRKLVGPAIPAHSR